MLKYILIFNIIFFYSYIQCQELNIDNDFGTSGISKFFISNSYIQGYKVAQTNDGSYLTINYLYNLNTKGFTLIKILGNGTIDISFATNGHFDYLTYHTEYPADFVILPDNKIALVFSDDNGKIELVILNENGSLYKNIILSPFPSNYFIPVRLLYKSDHLYIGGIYNSLIQNNELAFIIKTDIEGELDKTFGENGAFISEKIIELNARFQDMAFQNENLIVYAAGNLEELKDYLFLYRINHNGSGDLSFSDGGIVFVKNDYNSGFGTIKIDQAGDIYLIPFDFPAVIKINKDGFPDKNYGLNGVGIDDFFNDEISNSFFSLLQNDHSVLLFGDLLKDSNNTSPVIAKFNAEGIRDMEFGINGLFSEHPEMTGSYLNACFDKNGKLVIIGSCSDSTSSLQNSFLTRFEMKFTGLIEKEGVEKILIYPNPITSYKFYLFFESGENEPASFELFDLLGRKVSAGSTTPVAKEVHSIELESHINNGIYFLKIHNNKSGNSQKITLMR